MLCSGFRRLLHCSEKSFPSETPLRLRQTSPPHENNRARASVADTQHLHLIPACAVKMNIYHSTSSKIVSFAEDSSNDAASVVCSWPLSGQYGPGARLLYYVLVVVCIFVPHVEWLRSACLAAALLFPSIAAIHALIMTPIQQTKGETKKNISDYASDPDWDMRCRPS